jgi:hypothetical protein
LQSVRRQSFPCRPTLDILNENSSSRETPF